jgi:hypothetical protein
MVNVAKGTRDTNQQLYKNAKKHNAEKGGVVLVKSQRNFSDNQFDVH